MANESSPTYEEDVKDAGQAFPGEFSSGMSLRDWFAGQALADMASVVDKDFPGFGMEQVAKECYRMADAMIAERGKAD